MEEESEKNLMQVENMKERLIKMNLKVSEVVQDRDWIQFYRQYNEGVKEDN